METVEKILGSRISKSFSDLSLWKTCGKTPRLFHRVCILSLLYPQLVEVFHRFSTGFPQSFPQGLKKEISFPQVFHRFFPRFREFFHKFSTGFPQAGAADGGETATRWGDRRGHTSDHAQGYGHGS